MFVFGRPAIDPRFPSQPTCHVSHLPPYVQKYSEFKAKGVDVIACVAANDAFVMSGWGRVEGVSDKVRAKRITIKDVV